MVMAYRYSSIVFVLGNTNVQTPLESVDLIGKKNQVIPGIRIFGLLLSCNVWYDVLFYNNMLQVLSLLLK